MRLDDAVRYFRQHEGVIPHMYLDVVGLVTVGVGFLLRTAEDAVALRFVNRATGNLATAAEKRQEWTTVAAQEKARRAGYYRQFTQLDLPAEQIDRRLEFLLGEFENVLKRRFPNFERFPWKAQLGLLDMVYSLGPSGFFRGYPKMCAAVARQDWLGAAAECERGGVSATRNRECKQLFLDAAMPPALEMAETVALVAPAKKRAKKTKTRRLG
jgi:GH24 family phage-related lysozyme (muramidase)